MDDNIYFTPDLTPEDIEKAFDDETWLENVTEAALFGATNCYQKGKDSYAIMNDIIVYNVSRRMCELFVKKGKALPELIVWKKSLSVLDAYESLESVMAKLAIEKKLGIFKPTTIKIQIDNELIAHELQDWCARLEEEYPMIILPDLLEGNIYKISILADEN